MTNVEAPRQPIVTRPIAMLLVFSVGAMSAYYLLMPVVPLYAAVTGADGVGAGLATGVLMLGTVLAEFAVVRLLARFGYRTVVGLGLLLLGVPALLLAAHPPLAVVLVVCLFRGAGLGIVVVCGAALIGELVPAERRSEGLGLYGLAVGIPSIACLPTGLWLQERFGFTPVFLLGAGLALVVLAAAGGLPAGSGQGEQHGGVLAALRDTDLVRPAFIFAAITMASGILLTFLPLAAGSVATALLVQSCVTPLARWCAGWFGDRYDQGSLLLPAVLSAAAGTALMVFVPHQGALLAGMVLFGIGFGAAQNVTLSLMFARASPANFGQVSVVWNLAYDAGIGIGAIGFGLLVQPLGYPASFALTAAVLFVSLVPAVRDRRRTR
ncbi:MFS transporter [Streptosporangium sp. NPDC023615]|uniref:MFS transporter n=1 Tax=Streptosporangium sp. NPDC023615 TaxID=3154794 RepID=UPI0034464460